ncbi:hypothetical protein MHK_005934, partial [Candidatus Magnetomorum sp. HK-1]
GWYVMPFQGKKKEMSYFLGMITSEIFPIQGRINDQGTVILTTSIGDHLTGIAASGSIDKNRKVAETFFTNQGEKGSFSGKLIR